MRENFSKKTVVKGCEVLDWFEAFCEYCSEYKRNTGIDIRYNEMLYFAKREEFYRKW